MLSTCPISTAIELRTPTGRSCSNGSRREARQSRSSRRRRSVRARDVMQRLPPVSPRGKRSCSSSSNGMISPAARRVSFVCVIGCPAHSRASGSSDPAELVSVDPARRHCPNAAVWFGGLDSRQAGRDMAGFATVLSLGRCDPKSPECFDAYVALRALLLVLAALLPDVSSLRSTWCAPVCSSRRQLR